MNQEQLNTFIIAAKHLNFSEAAKELYISQPTVSHQISSLENELGTPLFIRNTRDITLTKAGKMFLEDAQMILDKTNEAMERVRMAKENPDLSLKIAYLLAPCHEFLPALINDFRSQYPQVEISIHRMNAHEISQALSLREYDLFYSIGHDLEVESQYSRKTIFSDKMSMIFPNSHPCAVSGKIDYNLLASEPFLTLRDDVGPYVEKQALRHCHSKKLYPKEIHQFESMEELMFEVESGFGYTILPSRNSRTYRYPLTYIELDGIYSSIDIGVAWLQNSDNPVVSWWMQFCGGGG